MPAIVAVVLLLASLGACAAPQSITGTVKRVLDGDSVIVRASGRDIEVRLGEIDTPEKGQPYADISRKALQGMLIDERVRLQVLDRDQYGRTVARVYRLPEELWINAEMVRRGHAWVYRRHVRDKGLYEIERDAQARRAGLWALPEAERAPPWQWRRIHPPEHSTNPRTN
ncbi:MAG: thermonuclease family protein [Steroidobacteraceae bacterium]